MTHHPSPLLFLAVLGATASTLFAQPTSRPPAPEGWSTSTAAGLIYQFDTDLDAPNAGDFNVTRAFADLSFNRPLNATTSIGLGLAVAATDYDFSTADDFGSLRELDLSFFYFARLDSGWSLIARPAIGYSGESGSDFADSLTYGGIFAASKQFNPDLRLGFGFAVFTGLEDTKAFPIITIQWKLNDRWTLQNPFRPGPAGPAGLEFAYQTDAWDLGFGGAYRSYRYRLDDSGANANQLFEYEGLSLFARSSHKLTDAISLDLYGGLIVAGSLQTETANGNKLTETDFDPAPFAALTLTGRF